MYTVVLEAREPLAVLIASLSINYFFFFFSIQVKNFFMNMGKKQKTTFIVFVFFLCFDTQGPPEQKFGEGK